MSGYELDCLQRQIIEMAQQIEGMEKWRKTAGGLTVPRSVEEYNAYARVSKQLDEMREQIDKLAGHVEDLWDQIGEKDGRPGDAGNPSRSVRSNVVPLHQNDGRQVPRDERTDETALG